MPMKGGNSSPRPSLHGYTGGVGPSKGASRLQWVLTALWAILCLKTMKDSIDMVEVRVRDVFVYEAFLYYNPLFMVALMVFFWGVNLYVFAGARFSYHKIFDLDHNTLTHNEIWKVALYFALTVLSSMAAYIYFFAHGAPALAAAQPIILYCAIPLVLALPFDVLYPSSRHYFLNTVYRMALPLQPISFADFFVADIFTSMAKVASDLERAVCRMANGQVATIAWMEADDVCGSHSTAIPCILALPFVCRFFQCLRQYSDTREKACLFNALKYATAFPHIVLSATKYHVPLETWGSFYRPLWLCACIVNASYSFYWDIARDWDFTCFSGQPCQGRNPLLRNNLYYSKRWVKHFAQVPWASSCLLRRSFCNVISMDVAETRVELLSGVGKVVVDQVYYWAMVSDGVLRASWTYKLSAHLRHNHAIVFTMSALEIYRRFQWVFFRVETEWNRMVIKAEQRASQVDLKNLAEDIGEEDKLLGSTRKDDV